MTRLFASLALLLSFFIVDAAAQRFRTIPDIQGSKNYSEYEGNQLRTSGVVTARLRNGFFIQSPDDKTDNNPNTSEGLFIFTRIEPPADAAIGNFVSVTGTVSEYSPGADPRSLPITQLSYQTGRDFIAVESKGNPLPKPIVLTVADFKPNSIDQLEKYEDMRVTVADMTVTAPTEGRTNKDTEVSGSIESDGVFWGVVKGTSRPFREAGFDVYDFLTMADKEKNQLTKDFPKIVVYDHNPERIRVQSTMQVGAKPIDVSTGFEIKNLTGVLYYSYRAYSLLVDPDSSHAVSGFLKATALPNPEPGDLMIAGMNVERLFDENDEAGKEDSVVQTDVIEKRFKKISLAIREYMKTPDVIGMVEVENLDILKRLADRINKDAVAAGKPNPKYEAYLIEGNDFGGIDNGFLVKSSRVRVIDTKQYGKSDMFKNPSTKEDQILNDRPPLVLRAAVKHPKTGADFEFTVIVNHLKSLNGYNDEKKGEGVRMKKKLQAEMLAKLVANLQKENPAMPIALVGDFNAFQFNDGITDIINTIKGTPVTKDAIFFASEDVLNPDLVNIVDMIKPEERYSYAFEGNAQVLDHILVNPVFMKHLVGFRYARINADFPEIYKYDASRVERYSDHDPAVAFFGFE